MKKTYEEWREEIVDQLPNRSWKTFRVMIAPPPSEGAQPLFKEGEDGLQHAYRKYLKEVES